MRRIINLILLAMLSFFILNIYASYEARGVEESFPGYFFKKQVKDVKSINDLFEIKSNVQLELSPESALANVTDLAIDAQGNYLVCDGTQLNQVWIFSAAGKFLRNLSQRGQGPGEYYSPLSVAVDKHGDIFINDYLQSKIIIYDRDYKYKNEIKNVRGHYIHVNSRDEIYLYDGMLRPMNKSVFDTIKKIGQDGRIILSFAPLMEEILSTHFSLMSDGMNIDEKDNIYEMNPLYYQVRKWTPEGRLSKTFNVPSHLSGIRRSGDNYVILNGPFCLNKNIVIIQREGVVDLYDTEGNYLAGGLHLPGKIRYARDREIYVELWEGEGQGEQSNPRIICYQLK